AFEDQIRVLALQSPILFGWSRAAVEEELVAILVDLPIAQVEPLELATNCALPTVHRGQEIGRPHAAVDSTVQVRLLAKPAGGAVRASIRHQGLEIPEGGTAEIPEALPGVRFVPEALLEGHPVHSADQGPRPHEVRLGVDEHPVGDAALQEVPGL